jgi:A/G-specific adenine glycosylase
LIGFPDFSRAEKRKQANPIRLPPESFLYFLFADFVYFAVRQFLNSKLKTKKSELVASLLDWFAVNARDLPWRRTNDPYAIWVSEIMLQQTQVKTVIPFWNRWMKELPTIEAAARAPSAKIHKLWEGLGYYTRVRNLQKAAKQILQCEKRKAESGNSVYQFPEKFEEILELPGIGRYTAGAICSIAFNQPTPILDGNVIRVLTRLFGIAENPKEKATNAKLWQLAEELVRNSKLKIKNSKPSCSHLNQSLMELGALICTPRNAQCLICPVKKLCVAFKENRVEALPNLGKRETATARRFFAFVIEHNGKFLVRQRPAVVVNAQLWEFPNVEVGTKTGEPLEIFAESNAVRITDLRSLKLEPLCTVKHSITRYRLTLAAFIVSLKHPPAKADGVWKTPVQMSALAFSSAHKKLASAAAKSILSDR